MEFRNLSEAEITALEKQGCFCSNWNDLNVKKDFSPGKIKNTVFKGKNFLGMLNEGDSGIFNSEITDCTIEDGSFISNVNQLVNYKIEANTVIENVNKISADENSSFGIGVNISVLNEAGGRELPLIPNLSSQIAYLIANYRHDAEMQDKLAQLCLNEIKKHKFSKGTIGSRSRISNVKEIKNVNIGECTVIENSALLKNGTVISNIDDPVFLGSNVNCENFVVLPGASITNNAVLENCFIGQAVKIGKQYSAENSAFFANCELFHGEACSIFAGPYTVSHHKSSLLIAGYFSFYNAGSGTNQSNHMYKLGPVHQGILERGSKTGSFSYLLFPSKLGLFSVVLGKHYNNFDSSDFPFSYITEEEGKSVLTPALNLFSVGTKRDSDKWKKRDKRKSKIKLDNINFDLYSPFIASRMINASSILEKLYSETPKEKKSVYYKGLKISRLLMKSCKKYYDLGIDVAIGEHFIDHIESSNSINLDDLVTQSPEENNIENQGWIDAGGQFMTKSDLLLIREGLLEDKYPSIDALNEEFAKFHKNYDISSWKWFKSIIRNIYSAEEMTPHQIAAEILGKWSKSKIKILNMILKDADKEFDGNSRLSYGIDGDQNVRDQDFLNVRGSFEENGFVIQIKEEINKTEEKYDHILSLLEK